jgi:hypothetical protein
MNKDSSYNSSKDPIHISAVGSKNRLVEKIKSLDDATCFVLESIASGLSAKHLELIDQKTDIVTKDFANNFRTRLKLHHATHEEVLNKKTFEFAFKAASIAAGRESSLNPIVTNAGYDVIIDKSRYSLKTEAGKNTSNKYIKISKLMEARWIRECRSGRDYLSNMAKIISHISNYDRILTLRAFEIKLPFTGFRYDLWEIPHYLFKLVASIRENDFTSRKESGTSTVVVKYKGMDAYKLRLDGSVEKVTLEKLDLSLCYKHATWSVESLVKGSDFEDELSE